MERENNSGYQLVLKELCDEDGELDYLKAFDFISKHKKLQEEASQVYSHVTKGLLTQSHYKAEQVISVVDNLQKSLVDKNEVFEDIIHIVPDNHTKKLVSEYFGKSQ